MSHQNVRWKRVTFQAKADFWAGLAANAPQRLTRNGHRPALSPPVGIHDGHRGQTFRWEIR